MNRYFNAGQGTDFARPGTGRIHNHIGVDRYFFIAHEVVTYRTGNFAAAAEQPPHLVVIEDLSAIEAS